MYFIVITAINIVPCHIFWNVHFQQSLLNRPYRINDLAKLMNSFSLLPTKPFTNIKWMLNFPRYFYWPFLMFRRQFHKQVDHFCLEKHCKKWQIVSGQWRKHDSSLSPSAMRNPSTKDIRAHYFWKQLRSMSSL